MKSVDHWPRGGPGRSKYDWDLILNGKTWCISVKECGNLITFRTLVHLAAKRRGVRAKTAIENGNIYVQAILSSKEQARGQK